MKNLGLHVVSAMIDSKMVTLLGIKSFPFLSCSCTPLPEALIRGIYHSMSEAGDGICSFIFLD